jgi:cobalamin biosynthesis protein CbiD
VHVAEAKLVTEKQVKELCKESLDDFITQDKMDRVQKSLIAKIEEVKMDLMGEQKEYAKSEKMRQIMEEMEQRIMTRIDNMPKQVITEKVMTKMPLIDVSPGPIASEEKAQRLSPQQPKRSMIIAE